MAATTISIRSPNQEDVQFLDSAPINQLTNSIMPIIANNLDSHSVILMQRDRLVQLRHASKCPAPPGQCEISPYCGRLKALWKHILDCKSEYCRVPLCASSRFILHHYGGCHYVSTDNSNIICLRSST